MRKCTRKSNADIKNEEVKGSSGEVEDIKIHRCSRKNHGDNINKEMKVSISKDEEIGIHKCRIISRVDILYEEV